MAIISDSFCTDLGIVLISVFIGVYFYFKHLFGYWERKGVEYVKPTLLFGNLKNVILGRECVMIELAKIHDQIKGGYGGAFMLNQPAIFIKDPDLIKQIFIKDFDFFVDRGIYVDEKADPLTGHLFALSGDRWRFMRNKLSPTFTSGKLKQMVGDFVSNGKRLQKYLENAAVSGDNVIEARDTMSKYTIDSIVSLAFGLEIDSFNNPDETFFKIGKRISVPPRSQVLISIMLLFAPKILQILKFKSTEKDVEDFIRSVTEQSLNLRENEKIVRKDFMQLIVQLRNTGTINSDGSWEVKVADGEFFLIYSYQKSFFLE